MLAGNVCICKALWVSKRALGPVQCALGLVGTVPASSGGGGVGQHEHYSFAGLPDSP